MFVKSLRLRDQRRVQFVQRGNELMHDGIQRRQMNGRGNDVVARLAAIDVVVRMNRFVAAFAAEDLAGAVGDHLVRVHVGGGAGTGLENIHHKLMVPFAVDDLLRGLLDGRRNFRRHVTQTGIRGGRVLLDQAQRADELA